MTLQTALITGATSGIGTEIAHQLAQRGHPLVFASRRMDRMSQLAAQFAERYGRPVDSIEVDLAKPGSATMLYDACQQRGHQVGVLVNNSGFGHFGPHLAMDLSRVTQMAQLNMVTLVELCTLFAPAMKKAGKGYILNVASVAGFQPIPYMAEYAATKAFVLNYSQALWKELRRHGVRVCALCPGPTESNFFAEATGDPHGGSPFGTMRLMKADVVARQGVDALFAGRSAVVPGGLNRALLFINRLVPRRWAVSIVASMFKKLDP